MYDTKSVIVTSYFLLQGYSNGSSRSHQNGGGCGDRHYYDSYLTINSPRDGRSQGLCGYYGKQGAGEDRKNGNFLSSSGSRGRHSMTSRAFFNGPLTIKTGESSHFNCHGFSRPQVNGRYGFKRIMSTIASAKSMAKMFKAEAGMEMKMRE